jgi:hypothetical protein
VEKLGESLSSLVSAFCLWERDATMGLAGGQPAHLRWTSHATEQPSNITKQEHPNAAAFAPILVPHCLLNAGLTSLKSRFSARASAGYRSECLLLQLRRAKELVRGKVCSSPCQSRPTESRPVVPGPPLDRQKVLQRGAKANQLC